MPGASDWSRSGLLRNLIADYLGASLRGRRSLLAELGKHKTGEGCISIKRLADVDLAVLEKLVADCVRGHQAHVRLARA